MDKEQEFLLCYEAYQNAYAIYSNFQVGALVVLKNGKYFMGSNIENVSYGLTNCAERSALFACYSMGYRADDILELCILSRSTSFASPCGACRQVINELMNPSSKVVMFNFKKEYREVFVKELLPFGFNEDDLHAKQ